MTAETPKHEIEATGNVTEEGVVTVEASFAQAKITLSWHVDETDAPDILVNALPTIAEQVLDQLVEAQAAENG